MASENGFRNGIGRLSPVVNLVELLRIARCLDHERPAFPGDLSPGSVRIIGAS
jgi:hypothetical protein